MSSYPIDPFFVPTIPPQSIDQFLLTSPSDFLIQLNQDRFTGKIIIQNPDDEFVAWQVYMGNGKIHYASSSIGSMERCRYLLKRSPLAKDLKLPASLTKEYDYFYQLWKGKILTYEEGRGILEFFTREALVHILSLPESKCCLSSDNELSMPLLNLDIEQMVGALHHKIRCWQSLKPQINSPFQRPLVHDWPTVESWLKETDEYGDYWLTQLHYSLSNLSCLYDIAHQTQSSTLDLSILFAKLLKSKQITMLPYQEITIEKRAHIVYIDENSTGQHIVSYSLEKKDFRVTSISDPCQALIALQNRKVDLIIINADMEAINGFQLTKLCRQTPQLEDIPILLIIDNNNLIHDIKMKLSGASGYLHKPFLPQELIARVEQHLPNSAIKSNSNN